MSPFLPSNRTRAESAAEPPAGPRSFSPPSADEARSVVRGRRLRRSRWRDPRLAGGVVLVGLSVALGAWAVDSATRTQEIYVLAADVAPGTPLDAEGVLGVVSAHPGTDAYVVAGTLPPGAVATRSLGAGELLPTGAVSTQEDLGLRSLVLEVSAGMPAGTASGDAVDLWSLPPEATAATTSDEEEPAQARAVAEGLLVSSVGRSGTGLIGTPTTTVEVMVPVDQVDEVLTAVGSGGELVLVPTGEER